MIFITDHMQKNIKKKIKNETLPLISAISIWERSAQICFIVIMVVTCDMVSFGVEFYSDSVNAMGVSQRAEFVQLSYL